jgi:hypothetical protein
MDFLESLYNEASVLAPLSVPRRLPLRVGEVYSPIWSQLKAPLTRLCIKIRNIPPMGVVCRVVMAPVRTFPLTLLQRALTTGNMHAVACKGPPFGSMEKNACLLNLSFRLPARPEGCR